MSRSAALILAVLFIVSGAAFADDRSDEAAWLQATAKLGRGDGVGARHEFERLAETSPGGRWSDDALAEAAAIAERQGDLAGARALWRRVLAEYPSSNQARRAGPRLTALEAAGGTDGHWDVVAATHSRLERAAAAAEDPTASLQELATVLEANPGYPRWFAAALWLAESWARVGERRLALQWVDRAIQVAGDPVTRFRAGFAKANVLADMGEFAAADATYRALVAPDDLAVVAVADARRELSQARMRSRLGSLAQWAILASAVIALATLRRRAGSWRGALGSLWPPPLEAMFLMPVAVVLSLMAETGNALAARAAQTILVGACVITWVSGAAFALARRRGTPGLGGVAVHLIVVVAATTSLCYAAIGHEQLLTLLIETWKRGHESH